MASIYNVDEETKGGKGRKVPSVEHDIRWAKKFLQKHSPESGDCLYDHIAELLEKILTERPKNAVDVFEDYSRKIKDERFKSKNNYLRDVYEPPAQYEDAKKFIKLYQALTNEGEEGEGDDVPEEAEKNDDFKRTSPDIMEIFFYLEQIDVALPRSEIVALDLSIRKLVADKPIKNVRFWGKIIGKPKNYYIVEAELEPEELLSRRSAAEVAEKREQSSDEETEPKENQEKVDEVTDEPSSNEPEEIINKNDESTSKLQLIFPPLPKTVWKAPPIVPAEEIGTGVNKNIYYICNSPGIDEWMELPLVTPQQIVTARQIVRLCTGDLESPIHTFPPFPGTEKNYLRAQIARISAATLVSPIGFYTFGESLDEEDEDEAPTEMAGEEDEAGSGMISENRHYEPLPIKELIESSMSNWCHHSPYILHQGRTIWWNPRKQTSREIDEETDVDEEDEEEDEEEDRENTEEEEDDSTEFQKEVGPPLLTPLSEDAGLESIGPWTARASSSIKSNDAAIAIVRSNIWPGSFAFASGKKFANVYIGSGQKFNPYNYSPPDMPMIQEQYKIGPEVTEIQDPTFEEEEAYRIAHLPPSKPGPLELGGEAGELTDAEDEADYDDDDDDDDVDDED